MSIQQIKFLIILIPTITIGIWEYVRHEFLLPYMTMEFGNYLSPLIVFGVTTIFALRLFNILEGIQKELEEERAQKAILVEREKLSCELHDGIAQSIFLLSVKLDKLEKEEAELIKSSTYGKIRKTIHHLHSDVRQAIKSLRNPPISKEPPWKDNLSQMILSVREDERYKVNFDWDIKEESLSSKEKIELFACIKEALMNIRKHANATEINVKGTQNQDGWTCEIEDNGIGFDIIKSTGLGIKMMKNRAQEMNWQLEIEQRENKTAVVIRKEFSNE